MLEAYGGPICHCGPIGSGLIVKLVNNLLCIANMKLAHDALELGCRLGLDPGLLRQALLAGSGRSFALDALQRLVTPQTALHVAALFDKDLALAQELLAPAGAGDEALARPRGCCMTTCWRWQSTPERRTDVALAHRCGASAAPRHRTGGQSWRSSSSPGPRGAAACASCRSIAT